MSPLLVRAESPLEWSSTGLGCRLAHCSRNSVHRESGEGTIRAPPRGECSSGGLLCCSPAFHFSLLSVFCC